MELHTSKLHGQIDRASDLKSKTVASVLVKPYLSDSRACGVLQVALVHRNSRSHDTSPESLKGLITWESLKVTSQLRDRM